MRRCTSPGITSATRLPPRSGSACSSRDCSYPRIVEGLCGWPLRVVIDRSRIPSMYSAAASRSVILDGTRRRERVLATSNWARHSFACARVGNVLRRRSPRRACSNAMRACAHGVLGKRCSCTPSYQAYAPTGVRGGKHYKSFASAAEAKRWRAQQIAAGPQSRATPRLPVTLAQAAQEFVLGARDGAITNRSGDSYKPSVVRS
jgi:hypothetical protein